MKFNKQREEDMSSDYDLYSEAIQLMNHIRVDEYKEGFTFKFSKLPSKKAIVCATWLWSSIFDECKDGLEIHELQIRLNEVLKGHQTIFVGGK